MTHRTNNIYSKIIAEDRSGAVNGIVVSPRSGTKPNKPLAPVASDELLAGLVENAEDVFCRVLSPVYVLWLNASRAWPKTISGCGMS